MDDYDVFELLIAETARHCRLVYDKYKEVEAADTAQARALVALQPTIIRGIDDDKLHAYFRECMAHIDCWYGKLYEMYRAEVAKAVASSSSGHGAVTPKEASCEDIASSGIAPVSPPNASPHQAATSEQAKNISNEQLKRSYIGALMSPAAAKAEIATVSAKGGLPQQQSSYGTRGGFSEAPLQDSARARQQSSDFYDRRGGFNNPPRQFSAPSQQQSSYGTRGGFNNPPRQFSAPPQQQSSYGTRGGFNNPPRQYSAPSQQQRSYGRRGGFNNPPRQFSAPSQQQSSYGTRGGFNNPPHQFSAPPQQQSSYGRRGGFNNPPRQYSARAPFQNIAPVKASTSAKNDLPKQTSGVSDEPSGPSDAEILHEQMKKKKGKKKVLDEVTEEEGSGKTTDVEIVQEQMKNKDKMKLVDEVTEEEGSVKPEVLAEETEEAEEASDHDKQRNDLSTQVAKAVASSSSGHGDVTPKEATCEDIASSGIALASPPNASLHQAAASESTQVAKAVASSSSGHGAVTPKKASCEDIASSGIAPVSPQNASPHQAARSESTQVAKKNVASSSSGHGAVTPKKASCEDIASSGIAPVSPPNASPHQAATSESTQNQTLDRGMEDDVVHARFKSCMGEIQESYGEPSGPSDGEEILHNLMKKKNKKKLVDEVTEEAEEASDNDTQNEVTEKEDKGNEETSELKKVPKELHPSFELLTCDLSSDDMCAKVQTLLQEHFSAASALSIEYLRWALQPSGYKQGWHIGICSKRSKKLVGFFSGVPLKIRIGEEVVEVADLNFLCVNKTLKKCGIGSFLIDEMRRRVDLEAVSKAVYVTFAELSTPSVTCQTWYRTLKDGPSLPEATQTPGLRKMEADHVHAVTEILRTYLRRFKVSSHFEKDDVAHWFLPRDEVVYSYVVVNPQTDHVTGFFSFFVKNSSPFKLACSFYHVATTDTSTQKILRDALIVAKNGGFDTFIALDIMGNNNKSIFKTLKFTKGPIPYHYHFTNFNLSDLKPSEIGVNIKVN